MRKTCKNACTGQYQRMRNGTNWFVRRLTNENQIIRTCPKRTYFIPTSVGTIEKIISPLSKTNTLVFFSSLYREVPSYAFCRNRLSVSIYKRIKINFVHPHPHHFRTLHDARIARVRRRPSILFFLS